MTDHRGGAKIRRHDDGNERAFRPHDPRTVRGQWTVVPRAATRHVVTTLAPVVEATAEKTAHRGAESGLPVWWLRLGLAFVFGYAAVAALSSPEAFLAYFPSFLPEWAIHFALPSFAVYELALAAAFLSGRHVHSASLLGVATLIGIVTFNLDAFDVLFRNIAIACAALALASVTQGEGPPRGRGTLSVRRRLHARLAGLPRGCRNDKQTLTRSKLCAASPRLQERYVR